MQGRNFEKILAKDFPNLGKDIKLADSRASDKGNSKESLTRQIIIKRLKIKDKEKKEEARVKDTPQHCGEPWSAPLHIAQETRGQKEWTSHF